MRLTARAKSQSGQTLIETIVAIFILTTALVTALGLAIYAFALISTSANQVIASNLAREGIDVVRMMRDSNWLAGDAAGGSFALSSCADINGASCYPQAFVGPSYNIETAGSYQLNFNSSTKVWSLGAGNNNYNLYQQADGTYSNTIRGNPEFARKIVISTNTSSPFTAQNPELIVKSVVGWVGRSCSTMTNQDPSTTNCKITVEEHLTNWKDYQ